jgi:simple sugar transport system ATP-binding protein
MRPCEGRRRALTEPSPPTSVAGPPTSQNDPPPVVELRGITKIFGAVVALKGVDIHVRPRECLGLVGDNGAGKSTLMKVLAGALIPTEGEIFVGASRVRFSTTRDARRQGIHMVFQDLALCEDLDTAANFYIGREPTRFGLVQLSQMHAQATASLEALGVRLASTHTPIRLLSGGQRQSVAIARAASFSPRLLILDEPTAALGVRQSEAVLQLIDKVKARGASVVLISHRLRDVLAVCDRIVVLFEGEKVADVNRDDTSLEDIVKYSVGGARPRATDDGNVTIDADVADV